MRPLPGSSLRPVLWLALAAAACNTGNGDDDKDDTTDDTDPDTDVVPTDIHLPLVETISLDVGDEDCPEGGIAIRVGIDDGSDGGTADDGALQDGEVTSEQVICNGVSGEDLTDAYGDTEPPEGTPGTAVIDLSGGDSTDSYGGEGGTFIVDANPGSRYGHLSVFPTGEVDADVALPPGLTVDLGSNPLEITGDTEIKASANPAGESVGSVVLSTSDDRIHEVTATGTEIVTGVHVKPGATLRLGRNDGSSASVALSAGLLNEGTIVLADLPILSIAIIEAPAVGGISVSTSTYHGKASSSIDTSGDDGTASTPGGSGGPIRVTCLGYTPQGFSFGACINEGTLDTSAGSGSTPGSAGDVQLQAYGTVVNTGPIAARGAAPKDANGGGGSWGGAIQLIAAQGWVLNSGALDASGGDGLGSHAGTAGAAVFSGLGVVQTGTVDVSGGDASTASCVSSCDGGEGGEVVVEARGPVAWNAELDGHGGEAAGTSGAAGDGASFNISAQNSGMILENASSTAPTTVGPVMVAGDLLLGGGQAPGEGGDGGFVMVNLQAVDSPGSEVSFRGYASIDQDGGDGEYGGPGGYTYMSQGTSYLDGQSGPSGGVLHFVPVTKNGGDGVAYGGPGGRTMLLATTPTFSDAAAGQVVKVAADLDAMGGSGESSGSPGGSLVAVGTRGVTLSGDLDLSAGPAAVEGDGGDAPDLDGYNVQAVAGSGTVSVEGLIRAAGADGVDGGGEGGVIVAYGNQVSLTGEVDLPGGAPDGNGGFVGIQSTLGSTFDPSSCDVAEDGDGLQGTALADGADVSGVCL